MAVFFNETIKLWTRAVLMTSKKVGEGEKVNKDWEMRRSSRQHVKMMQLAAGYVTESSPKPWKIQQGSACNISYVILMTLRITLYSSCCFHWLPPEAKHRSMIHSMIHRIFALIRASQGASTGTAVVLYTHQRGIYTPPPRHPLFLLKRSDAWCSYRR